VVIADRAAAGQLEAAARTSCSDRVEHVASVLSNHRRAGSQQDLIRKDWTKPAPMSSISTRIMPLSSTW
jgi:hypothetical protein